jgi:hypothetical protein
MESGVTQKRFPWKRTAYSGKQPWPPPGASLTLLFENSEVPGVQVSVHYEMYDGLPVMSKWLTIRNESGRAVKLLEFISEVLAVVETESLVEASDQWRPSHLQVDSDCSFVATHSRPEQNETAHWEPDPNYNAQVNYRLKTPALLHCCLPLGARRIVSLDSGHPRRMQIVRDYTAKLKIRCLGRRDELANRGVNEMAEKRCQRAMDFYMDAPTLSRP